MPFNEKDFPSSAELDRVKAEHGWYDIYSAEPYDWDSTDEKIKSLLQEYFSNDKAKARLLSRALNVGAAIVDTATDFLFGEPVEIVVEGDGKLQEKVEEIVERNRIRQKFEESSSLLQSIGHTHFKLRKEDGKAVIEEVPFDFWFPNWSNVPAGQETTNVREVVYLTDVDASGAEKKYVYVQDYFIKDKKCSIEHSLWTDKGGKVGSEVSLDTLDSLPKPDAKSLRKLEETKLDRLPLVALNLRKNVRERYGQSIFKKVKTLLDEINERLTQVSIQFLKHLNAKIQIPEGAVAVDEDGNIKTKDLEVLLAKAGEPDAKYITYDNPLIEDAFKHIERLLREIAKLTQTPDDFLVESEKGGVEKVEAIKVRFMPFLKRVRRYDSVYDEGIKAIIRLALKIEGVENADKVKLKVIFDEGLPQDVQYDVQTWSDAYDAGLASRETAVKKIHRLDGEELDEELDRIDEDDKLRPKLNVSTPFANGMDPEPPQDS